MQAIDTSWLCFLIVLLACFPNSAVGSDAVLAELGSGESSLSKFELSDPTKWSIVDGSVIYKSDTWSWSIATLNVGVDDYRIDADVSVGLKDAKDSDLVNPGKWASLGVIFRKSGDKAVVFFLGQPCGGWAALSAFLPVGHSGFPGKESVYGISKDDQNKKHHLTVFVKGNLANCYVDGELANVLDISDYPHGDVGLAANFGARFASFCVSKLPADAKVVSSRPVRDLLFGGKICPAESSWKSGIERSVKILDDAIAEGSAEVPGMEHMPAYTYRCVTWMKAGITPFYAYPAFHHSLIMKSLLKSYEYTGSRKYLTEALKLANWELAHSTPASYKLPNVPYSTTYNGQMGGNVDQETIMLDKVGVTGRAYLELWRLTGRDTYKQGAIRIAETLLGCQLPDGRWQGRVNPITGAVVQDYVSNQIFNIQFLDELAKATGDHRYTESSKNALAWMLQNPVKTWRWTGYYEDVVPGEESVGNWDAIEFARYLMEHRQEDPKYLAMAKDISDWVATSFAINEKGRWPVICEQSCCMPVMACHTLHYAALLNDLYKATHEDYYRKAAVSATNAGMNMPDMDAGWYSLALAPLYLGLDLTRELNTEGQDR